MTGKIARNHRPVARVRWRAGNLFDPAEAVEVARRANAALAELVRAHSDRFAGFAALPMQDPAAAEREPRHDDAPAYDPVWAAAAELERGVPAVGNGELVGRLASIAKAIERPPATVEQATALLGLGG